MLRNSPKSSSALFDQRESGHQKWARKTSTRRPQTAFQCQRLVWMDFIRQTEAEPQTASALRFVSWNVCEVM